MNLKGQLSGSERMLQMISPRKRHWAAQMHYRALAIVFVVAAACTDADAKQPAKRADNARSLKPDVPSAHDLIGVEDFEKFQPGRSMDDVLKDVQWRGNFAMASRHKGKSLAAITYQLAGSDPGGYYGELALAVFVDDKFVKFVQPPDWKMEAVEANDRRASRPAPLKLGDFSWLIKAAEAKPLDIKALDKEVKERPEAPSDVDPGLTAVMLLLGPALNARMERERKENVKLRDQYNAARVKIGMTRAQVEKILGATAMESGTWESGSYKLYGSPQTFDLVAPLHFSNVAVLYRDGKVDGIYSGSWVYGLREGTARIIDGVIRWK